jgi:hypothetical protein
MPLNNVSKLTKSFMNQEKVKLNKKDKKEVKRKNLKKEVKKNAKPKKPTRRY